MQSSKPTLNINLQNIEQNYQVLKSACPNAEVGAAVKADAYGLGAHKIAPILKKNGCKHFFVANCDEGIILRSIIGKDIDIYVFHGVFHNDVETFIEFNLIPVLNHLEQIEIWQKYANKLGQKLPCYIHIDTGMHRLGMQESEINTFDIKTHASNLDIQCVMSHLLSAEDPEANCNKMQLEKFNRLSTKFPGATKSLANSSGIFLGPDYHFDLTRPGAAIYGLDPTPYMQNSIIKPIATLKAPIIQLNSLKAGESVGYNGTYINNSKKSCSIATIPVGYADGFLRHFSNKGCVMIESHEAPIIGRISMDLTIIDISNIPSNLIFLGQSVEVLGELLTADKIAKLCGTNGYEILTSLGSRYERIYS
jgi:alanine racemase